MRMRPRLEIWLWLVMAAVLLACGGSETTPEAEAGPSVARVTATITAQTPQPLDTPETATAAPDCRGRIAFLARQSGAVDLYVVNADGSGLTNLTDDPATEQSPAWSPDGKRIAFIAMRDGRTDLYSISADGGSLVQLTDLPGREYAPSWSPDGKQILFASTVSNGSELFALNVDSGEVVQLTNTVMHKTEPTWAPDGAYLAFTQLDSWNQGDVFVMAADGSGVTNLTENPAHDCCPVWSPDSALGRGRIAFLSSRDDQGSGLLPRGRSGAYRLASLLVRADSGGDPPALSGIVQPLTTVLPEQPRDLYLMNADGSRLRNLTSGVGRESDPAWSPEGAPGGRPIAFVSDRDGNDEIYVMAVSDGTGTDDGALTRLTHDAGDDLHPAWSPDGACIAFLSRRDGAYGVYLVKPDGSGLWKLADGASLSRGPVWAP
jgi:Tol biopolymer transport system component